MDLILEQLFSDWDDYEYTLDPLMITVDRPTLAVDIGALSFVFNVEQ